MVLRLAPRGTVRLPVGDDGWIEVRPDISRKEFNNIALSMPDDVGEDGIDMQSALDLNEQLFKLFVVGWSVVDEDGDPVPVDETNYQELSRQSAQLIDTALVEHFNSLSPNRETQTKSEGPSV